MSPATGKKAHRRNTSISASGNAGLLENLLAAAPTQHIDNSNMIQNPTFTIIKEKNEQFPIKKQPRKSSSFFGSKSSSLDIRNVILFFIFLWALVVFLSSLCGIGPVDEELLKNTVAIDDRVSMTNETTIGDDDIKDSFRGDDDSWEDITQSTSIPLNADIDDDHNIDFDTLSIEDITDQQIDEEDTVENMILEHDDITDEKFGSFDDSSNSTQIGIPNKLKRKKKIKYEVDDALYEDKVAVDYSNYTYVITKPHFTHLDVIESLSTEEHDDYVALRISQRNTDDSLDNSCGSWQDKYTELHEKILNGLAPQRYASYICEAKVNCGGLADRILGMTSTFLFALLTDRAFLADWQVPLPLDTIFDSPNIDWSYDSLDPYSSIKDLKTEELNIIDYDSKHLDYHFSLSNWTTRYPEPFMKIYTNQGLIQKAFDSKYYSSKLKEIGLRPHTALGCFLDYLFRPVPQALSFITEYTALFALPSIFSIGIHIWTGDTYEQSYSLQDYNHFFNCADQLTQTYAAPDQKVIYYLVTDSLKLRAEAYTKLEHVIISGLPIDPGHSHYDRADGVNNAIVENWILSKTDYRVISQNSFGRLAAFHSKQLHSTVSLSKTESKFLDCTREDAFTTFNQLADEWSLVD